MSELNTDTPSADNELITQDSAQVEPGTTESGPELATGEGDNPDKINQDAVQDRINKVTQKRYEAERATKTAIQERDALQAKFDAIEANKPAPTVSEMPDRFDMSDEEFNAALQKRDTQRQELSDHNAAQKARQTASQAANDKALEDANAKIKEAGDSFRKKADQLGISKEIQDSSAQTVMNYGVSNDLLVHICGYDDSPLIMQYLASNPAELHELAGMGLAQAAIHVDGAISKKSAALRPKTSNAPDPVVPLSGNGVDPNASKHPAFKGGTYS